MPFKDKSKARESARRNYNPQKRRERHLISAFGIDSSKYESLLVFQGGVCAICKGKNNGKAFHVDHSHATGKVRGLLCSPCNMAIGRIGENIQVLQKAMSYIVAHRGV